MDILSQTVKEGRHVLQYEMYSEKLRDKRSVEKRLAQGCEPFAVIHIPDENPRSIGMPIPTVFFRKAVHVIETPDHD